MTEPERPLRLDATRDEALEHAAKLVAEAWRSFDRFRPEEPPLDERVRELIRARLPEHPTSLHEALDDAARILDASIAQPRPRYFAFIGSSGLEIGTVGDLLAQTYDINLAVDARAATVVEHQAVRWSCSGSGRRTSARSRSTGVGACGRTRSPRRSTRMRPRA